MSKPKIVAKITQRDATEAELFFAERKLNASRLEKCTTPHTFVVGKTSTLVPELVYTYRCAKCGGELDPESKRWYEQGVRHGVAKL